MAPRAHGRQISFVKETGLYSLENTLTFFEMSAPQPQLNKSLSLLLASCLL